MTFHPGRESRWEYADQTVEAIERWNCSKGHGCVHGAERGTEEWKDPGPGGTCGLLAAIFIADAIPEMDDDGTRVTCRSYEEAEAAGWTQDVGNVDCCPSCARGRA